jgi:hypothetical protein
VGGGGGATSNDRGKDWFFINHSLLSGKKKEFIWGSLLFFEKNQ